MSPSRRLLAAACLAVAFAPQALAQATPEQKAYAESQKQKREAAEKKRTDAEQKQRDSASRQRDTRDWQERGDARRQQEWDRARDTMMEDRSGVNVGKPQSLSGSSLQAPPQDSSTGRR